MLNVGVLGTGRIGKIHIQNLMRHAKAKIILVADPFIDENFMHSFNLCFSRESQDVLEHEHVEAVFICTSSDTHYELIKKAIFAGKKAIFCEKPIDLDLHRILEIEELAKKHEVFLQVGFNRRFDSNFEKIAKLVQQGAVGRLVHTRIVSRDFCAPPKNYIEKSGGIFLDMSIHDFDMLRYVTGGEVEEVFVRGACLVSDYDDIDSALISLVLNDGSLASIENCREAVYGYDQRLEVFGRKARVACENKYDNSVILCDANYESRANPLDFFLERYADSYCKELDNFICQYHLKKPPSVGLRESIEATLIALAAMESLKQKCSISLNAIRKQYIKG